MMGLSFFQDVALNNVRENGKPQFKLSYKLLKKEYLYNTLLDIYPYTTWIQLKFFLDGIQPSVTVVGKRIFTVIFILHVLSHKTIWNDVSLVIILKM